MYPPRSTRILTAVIELRGVGRWEIPTAVRPLRSDPECCPPTGREREETAEILGRHEAPIILSWTASSSPGTVAHHPAADFGIRGGGRRWGIVEDPLSAESIMI